MELSAEIRSINSDYKNFIEKIRYKYNHTLSSHAFASLHLWQHAMRLSLLCGEDFFTVKCEAAKPNMWFFPCGNQQEAYDFISENISDSSFSMCYLRESDKNWLEEKFPDKWDFYRTDGSDEYICNVSEYTSLRGSKFSEIRRKIRKINRECNITIREISEETLSDAIYVVNNWNTAEHSIGENGVTDSNVAEFALNERKSLDINGIIVYSDCVPVSVFAGFPLSDDTVDVLIGKCTSDAPKGTAYYALREYLHSLNGKYIFCNHEEDLGIEGIRQMKSSLFPCKKNEMWEAVLK